MSKPATAPTCTHPESESVIVDGTMRCCGCEPLLGRAVARAEAEKPRPPLVARGQG